MINNLNKKKFLDKNIKNFEKLNDAHTEYDKVAKKLHELKLKKLKLEEKLHKEKLKPTTIFIGLLAFFITASIIVNLVFCVLDFADCFLAQAQNIDAISTIILSFHVLFSVAASVSCFLIGVFLFVRMRNIAAISCLITIFLLFFDVFFIISTIGFSLEFWIYVAQIVILAILSAYLDPILAQERILQGKKRVLKYCIEDQESMSGKDSSDIGYIKLNMVNIFWIFLITSILGIWIEFLYCGIVDGVWYVRNGMLFAFFSPIYGFGAILMSIILNKFQKKNPIIIFFIAAFIGTVIEFFCSWYFEFSFGIRPWDYSHTFLNINGRVNLAFWFFWGVLGLLWIKFFLPLVLKVINFIPWNLRYLLTAILFVLMLLNGIMTLQAVDCWQLRSRGKPITTEIQQYYNQNFNDAFMEEKFANMVIQYD